MSTRLFAAFCSDGLVSLLVQIEFHNFRPATARKCRNGICNKRQRLAVHRKLNRYLISDSFVGFLDDNGLLGCLDRGNAFAGKFVVTGTDLSSVLMATTFSGMFILQV